METLYDTLPLVPEGNQLSHVCVGLLLDGGTKSKSNVTDALIQ